MQKILFACIFVVLTTLFFVNGGRSMEDEIAVLVPLQHPAMDEIVRGLREELGPDCALKVYNALGDATLQAAILQQLKSNGTRYVLPIGTATTQMTLQRLPNCQIVHLAAAFQEEDRKDRQPLCGVLDELPPENTVDLAQALIPDLSKMTLIHSPADKIYPEIAALEARATELGIEVQRLLVQAQSDLYTMTQQIADDSQVIVVLKDHMVVAGIATVSETAGRLGIPVLACDEGSVRGGANFASGVPEAAIGRAGAQLLQRILKGESAADLPISAVSDVRLFYRGEADASYDIHAVAEQFGYTAEELDVG